MKEGILHINGVPVKRTPDGEWLDKDYDGHGTGEDGVEDDKILTQYIETLPNGVEHLIVEESDSAGLDNTDEFVVPAGHYFGMGDNRDNSSDSRVFGYIPEENIVGRASFIFYSTGSGGSLLFFWDSIPRTRLDRLFTGIH